MTFSTFTAWFVANRTKMPRSVAAEVRREALARVGERMRDGYGATVLTFDDLIKRGEAAIEPR